MNSASVIYQIVLNSFEFYTMHLHKEKLEKDFLVVDNSHSPKVNTKTMPLQCWNIYYSTDRKIKESNRPLPVKRSPRILTYCGPPCVKVSKDNPWHSVFTVYLPPLPSPPNSPAHCRKVSKTDPCTVYLPPSPSPPALQANPYNIYLPPSPSLQLSRLTHTTFIFHPHPPFSSPG